MTESDYLKLYRQARSQTALVSLRAQVAIRSIFLKASKQTTDKLRDALNPGKRELSESEWLSLRSELADKTITDRITNTTIAAISAGTGLYIAINAKYLKDALPSNNRVSVNGINKLASIQKQKAIDSLKQRTYGNGKTFSTRVWDAKAVYDDTIKKIVQEGIRIGRDPAKIAQDITVYTSDGREALAKRWASLERGTSEWTKRLPKNIDWRAIRVIRSELQATLQKEQLLAGESNPGSTQMYKWILGPGLDHCDECIDYSSQTFTKENIPSYPHPHCGCIIQPVLRDRETFVRDLKEWVNGNTENTRYITDWYNGVYMPAQGK
jgi:hypothetical protein